MWLQQKQESAATQVLSGNRDIKTLTNWLNTLVTISTPKEIVIDDKAVIVLGTVQSFTEFQSLESYLNKCHHMLGLDGDEFKDVPKCFIRFDAFYFIRNLHNSNVFQKCDNRVKNFFLQAIGVVCLIDDFEVLKNIVENILILSLCQFETELTENSRTSLKELVTVYNITEFYSKMAQFPENVFTVDNDETIIACPDKVKIDWFKKIKENVLQITIINQTVDDKENLYYFPSLMTLFDTIIYKVPMWSPIMTRIFQSPHLNISSLICETKFKFIERNIFKKTKL